MDEEKSKKWEGKLKALMAEFTEDMMSEEDITEIQEKIKSIMAKEKISFGRSTLNAFKEGAGFMFQAMASDRDPKFQMMIIMSLEAIAKRMNDKVNKAVDDNFLANLKVAPEDEQEKQK